MSFFDLNEEQKGFLLIYTLLALCILHHFSQRREEKIDAKLTREREIQRRRFGWVAERLQEIQEDVATDVDETVEELEGDVVDVEDSDDPNVGRARSDLGPATGPNGSLSRGDEEDVEVSVDGRGSGRSYSDDATVVEEDVDPEERLEEIASEGVQDTVDEIEPEEGET